MLHVGTEDGDTFFLACGEDAVGELESLSHDEGIAELLVFEERLSISRYRNRALGEWHRLGESPRPVVQLIRLRYV